MPETEPHKGWSSPADISGQVRKRWNQGLLLGAKETVEARFPMPLRLKRPRPADLNERFNQVRDWVEALAAGDRNQRGFGYVIEWKTVNHRIHGSNRVPAGVLIPTRADALKLIGKTAAAETFEKLRARILGQFPELTDWLARRPMTALDHAEDWPRLLAVLTWFRQHPRCGLYLRELDIEDVDTKFIEQRRKLIGELLDQVMESRHIDTAAKGVKGFDKRYGLRRRPALVRFRILDAALAIGDSNGGIDDLSLPAEQFARLDIDAATIFITENETNGLAFPAYPSAIVIFGLGYGLDRLARIDWLAKLQIHYWGDIDTHGFAILNRLRHHLPHTESLLMDRATLDAHRQLWTREPKDRRFTGQLTRLSHNEQQLFETLRDNRIGERIRLEQERVGFGWLTARLHRIQPGASE
ncbi:MAG: Wadjet anti-phage system protein JetD domain-containing protein [Wenzhouxiangellaceae bacterium]